MTRMKIRAKLTGLLAKQLLDKNTLPFGHGQSCVWLVLSPLPVFTIPFHRWPKAASGNGPVSQILKSGRHKRGN